MIYDAIRSSPLVALAICAFSVTAEAGSGEAPGPAGTERMQHWAADHEALLDAKLAGLKAAVHHRLHLLHAHFRGVRAPPIRTAATASPGRGSA